MQSPGGEKTQVNGKKKAVGSAGRDFVVSLQVNVYWEVITIVFDVPYSPANTHKVVAFYTVKENLLFTDMQ